MTSVGMDFAFKEINSIVEWDKREMENEEHDYYNAT
jgi:hypothetical protein